MFTGFVYPMQEAQSRTSAVRRDREDIWDWSSYRSSGEDDKSRGKRMQNLQGPDSKTGWLQQADLYGWAYLACTFMLVKSAGVGPSVHGLPSLSDFLKFTGCTVAQPNPTTSIHTHPYVHGIHLRRLLKNSMSNLPDTLFIASRGQHSTDSKTS